MIKRIMAFVLGVGLLTGCSSAPDLEGTWILSSGQEEKGCTQRFTFLEKGNVEVQNEDEMPFVMSFERLEGDQYKMDGKQNANLTHFKVVDKKLHVRVSGATETCFYDQIKS